jgi:hypothetical protein
MKWKKGGGYVKETQMLIESFSLSVKGDMTKCKI